MRKDVIRTKIKEIEECVGLVEEHLPDTFEGFSSMGLIKDGIYKRIEFAIEDVFDICAVKKNRGIFRERRMRWGIYMGSSVETLVERPGLYLLARDGAVKDER